MLIKELVLNNFRIYEGENRFELAPRKRYGRMRPIVLFGGLNGAGKTSLLTGLRLALYGRSSLGRAPSQKDYEAFLKKSIHRYKVKDQTSNEASVELSFTYAKLGIDCQYRVVRSWRDTGKSVKEELEIFENGNIIKGLSYEQAQNFLNELIPIGVSDLFFFDGEKIKELAEDSGGAPLESSIKKLMGLDLIERLSGDLTVLNRNLTKTSSLKEVIHEIEVEQIALNQHRAAVEHYRNEISMLLANRAEISQNLYQLQAQFDERGGHFSSTRKEIENEIDREFNRKSELTGEIALYLADATPLSLSRGFCERAEAQIRKDLDNANPFSSEEMTSRLKKELAQRLKNTLDKSAVKKVDSALTELIERFSSERPEVLHDLTLSQASDIMTSFKKGKEQSIIVADLFTKLDECEVRLDELGAALSRAPDDSLIQADFENLQKKQVELATQDAKIKLLRESARKEAELAVETARKLDKLYEKAAKSSDQARVLDYIGSTNELLEDFIHRTALSKISDLEYQFVECFSRLMRKDDMNLRIKIDPDTFRFELLNQDGSLVDKDDLSAGEKQIFAISILEALAKSSGRQLPMIVDTPLGRLDSEHRGKLIKDYFPRASHQMIILSTDTEVDEGFYQSLSPEIARAFKLEYDSAIGATQVTEGYFWQQQNVG